MRSNLLCALLVVSVLIASAFAAELKKGGNKGSAQQPDFYSLSMQYPGTICQTLQKSGCKVPSTSKGNFTIHGLWPDAFDGNHPFNCQNIPFKMDALNPIREQLDLAWTDYLGDAEGFYSHEWSKHGTCSYDIPELNELNYFKYALNLHERVPISIILARAQIVPRDENYSIHDFVGAIQGALGVKIELNCKKAGLLGEVRVCFDKKFNLMDCPTASRTSSCGSEIHYPRINSSRK